MLRDLPGGVHAGVELLRAQILVLSNEDLADVGFGCGRDLAQVLWVHRHLSPSQDLEVLSFDLLLEDVDAEPVLVHSLGKEYHAHPVFPGLGQFKVTYLVEEGMGHLDQYSRSVTRSSVGAHRAPVL